MPPKIGRAKAKAKLRARPAAKVAPKAKAKAAPRVRVRPRGARLGLRRPAASAGEGDKDEKGADYRFNKGGEVVSEDLTPYTFGLLVYTWPFRANTGESLVVLQE